MPRKDFQADLRKASVPGRFPCFEVKAGHEDGFINFTYTLPDSTLTFHFQASVPDTSEYPKNHIYFTFSEDSDIPEALSDVLNLLQSSCDGLPIEQFFESVGPMIANAIQRSNDEIEVLQDHVEESGWDSDCGTSHSGMLDTPELATRIKSDLRTAKAVGYRVGIVGELTGPTILSISCRIAKLGISNATMRAWSLESSQYLVLLLRYPLGYTDLDHAIWKSTTDSQIQMHIGLCDSYKPSLAWAMQAFSCTPAETPGKAVEVSPVLKPLFIGNSLHALLNTHFVTLVQYRLQHSLTWAGAERYLAHPQECVGDIQSLQETRNNATAGPLLGDHLKEDSGQKSLSLVAMQFTLRRLVKCTEFCLNCHCKIEDGFEALMPYVCSNELCLYQYMNLGMGSSLEWEITTQPYVVDMLVSFTYARAYPAKLEDYPSGLGIQVPSIVFEDISDRKPHEGVLHWSDMRLITHDKLDLRVGDWMMLVPIDRQIDLNDTKEQWHCRVQDLSKLPVIHLSPAVIRGTPGDQETGDQKTGQVVNVRFVLYNVSFDSLTNPRKCRALNMLLDTLPSVEDMRDYIIQHTTSNSKSLLASWRDRISPSALYVLKWIVASNRSCIMYEDNPDHMLSGLGNFAQFRLAQGAPDKEHRFVQEVKKVASESDSQFPTLFAWHGSPLWNWHSILREGLHFKYIANGRASGNGVYLHPQFQYSISYTKLQFTNNIDPSQWPKTKLNIQKAIALNEVVNAPTQFVCTNPSYVVDKLSWIQPRYLIIEHKSSSLTAGDKYAKPANIYTQDPQRHAFGPENQRILVPAVAASSYRNKSGISKGREDKPSSSKNRRKRVDAGPSCPDNDDDMESVLTFDEDHRILLSDDDDDGCTACDDLSMTDFRPGRLDASTLQLMGPPKYATTTATKSLQKHLQATLKVQDRQPLHELGWYIDPDLVNNVYQWIVELHSFEPTLPLAKELKSAGHTSIILELRFPPQFPMSPPFVRVIRPRFLPFSRGGGGHVTAGGAMCMELLTSSGWSPVSSIESILLQVRMAITSVEPVAARLDPRRGGDYSVGEAVAAYQRVCQAHGWTVPTDLMQVSW
ncbi:hypothetical protein BDV25DRAFT_129973 [Aspergillus avenaceus]|uniref:UBC core domain-containing protein n=1 Tax=Aspergillus avenaceus TaxID=36643 RepID=A0A5N6TUZ0_ASPAV|nr:hypothetical protein BDV25DRAFT_129973 [Aspergillus avenaceus]